MAMVPSLQRLQRLFPSELQTEESTTAVAATRLPNDRLVWSAEPYSAPETQLNIAGSSKVPSREVRQANRAVRRIELPDCGKHGPQGRLSAPGTLAASWRLEFRQSLTSDLVAPICLAFKAELSK